MTKKNNKKKRTIRISTIAWLSVLVLIVSIISLSIFLFFNLYSDLTVYFEKLPVIMEQISSDIPEASQIFDTRGNLIAIIHLGERRFYTQLKEISPLLINAVISTEDIRFYNHYGIDIRGIIRAFWVNLRTGSIAEGGSTITQQLARDLFNLTLEKTWQRKFKEIAIAMQLENLYSKDEILEMYLNIYFLGEGNYGVEAASRYYFGKSSKELTLNEAAIIAGIFTAPSRLNPIANYDGAINRMNVVLNKMHRNNFITLEEFNEASNIFPDIRVLEETFTSSVQYFTDYVKSYLQDILPREVLFSGGLKIHTTLDNDIQKNLEQALNSQLNGLVKDRIIKEVKDEKNTRQPQGALIALNPQTGEILGMVGGREYKETPLNRVFSLRQPGSTFKAFVYAAALESKLITPITVLESEPITMETPAGLWSPTEYVRIEGRNFYGSLNIRDALVKSSNIIAIKVAFSRGIRDIIYTAQKMGIKSNLNEVYSLPIGSSDVTLFELAYAYAVLANGGYKLDPQPIKLITTSKGVVVKEFFTHKAKALSSEAAYVLTDILKDVADRELRGGRSITFPVAGKTGTSDKHRDAWFIGYTPELLIGVWTGMDNQIENINMTYNTGIFAQKIWQHAIVPSMVKYNRSDFIKPPGVEDLNICMNSKLLATPLCPKTNVVREVFLPSTSPKKYCDLH